MIIHPIEDTIHSSPYSNQQEQCPEVQLLQRLVWVQYQSYWWPALLFQDYSELQDFVADEMDPIMKAQMAVAIMRQLKQRMNTKVARLLGKSTIEVVEITTKYHEFYIKLPEFLPKAIDRPRYGRETQLFLDMHRALDQVEVIISEITEKPFSLLPGMGSITWLQKAQAQVAKREFRMDKGACTYYPELRDKTKGDTSISPVAQERPMADLIQSQQSPIPSHIQQQFHRGGRDASNQDQMLQQYQALSKLAHDHSDDQSVESMFSTGVVPPERTSSGKAVRAIKHIDSASTKLKSNRTKHSADKRIGRKSMPSIQEQRVEGRDEMASRTHRITSDSRRETTAPETTSLRKIGGRVRAPLARQTKAGIRRPPMTLAKEMNRVAVPTKSHDGHIRRVQEYLLHQQMSVTSDHADEAEACIDATDGHHHHQQQILPIATPVSQDDSSSEASRNNSIRSRNNIRQNDHAGNVIQMSDQSDMQDDPPRPKRGATNKILRHGPPRPSPSEEREEPTGDSFSNGTDATSIVDHRTATTSQCSHRRRRQTGDLESAAISSSNFDDYLSQTEKTLELLIKRERSSLQKQLQRGSQRRSAERHYNNGGRDHQRSRSGCRRSTEQRLLDPSGFFDGCFLADEDQYEPSVATSYADDTTASIEILPGLEGDDIIPGLSARINRMMADRGFIFSQERPRAAKAHHSRKNKTVPIEILPGLEGDDIVPGLNSEINKLIAKKGFFSRQDVLNLIEELEEPDDESISINCFDEFTRQRVRDKKR
ncbi:unnamed protein product [Cylindrotheca closterium]|uniref:PWWP domain-containing protein n=1 Tax=Cylindrotheca closterium TaxID=2856 RepID=A0AAD2JPV9_9STRA|nr:unnamed protein product [Cylindrotheca closterium]